MMKKIRKFFDENKKEVESGKAVSCHEIVVDEDGRIVSDAWYFLKGKDNST
jgi:hypothetical protein